jgi:hypothetical protein
VVGPVKENLSLANAIVHLDLKTSRSSDQKLITLFVGMGASGFPSRNVVQVKYPFDVKREVNLVFNG